MVERTPAPSHGDAGRARRTPRMGRLDALDFARPPRRISDAMPRGRMGWSIAGAMAVLLLALLLLRKPLADLLWPSARVQELSQQAGAALARGHLTATNGTGARELYEAAIAIDPDRVEPRAGLARVAHAALGKAATALGAEDFPQAHRWLALARELAVPRAQADAFARRLRAREADVAGIPQLLARADAAAAPQDALPLYARVLSLRPQNIRALEGREDALSVLLQQAQSAVDRGDVIAATALVGAVERYDAGHVDLPQVRDTLTRVVDALRQRTERAASRGELAAAETGFRQLLALDGDDAAAQRGLAALAAAHAARAERAAANFDFAGAERSLERARALQPDAPAVAQAQQRIAASRATRSRLGDAGAPARQGPRTRARVAALLRDAAAAEARGDLLTPPGESAYDKVRAAAALAPQSPGVRNAQRRLAPAARACFERELPRNDLGRARACLESWAALSGEGAATRRARTRLAQRWLAVGDERIGAGQIAAAQAALQAAHTLDRSAPGIEEFRQRLRVATASGE
jgi:tetratricopeptide (TPR) repeat protein